MPGPAPVLVAAAVAATGGPGSNGTLRVQIEWTISDLTGDVQSGSILSSANVLLHTNKGSVDVLDTFFYTGASNGNGTLDLTDFETQGQIIAGVAMPVPSYASGTDGTFSFDVTTQLQKAIDNGFSYFVIQARADEATLIPNPNMPPSSRLSRRVRCRRGRRITSSTRSFR